MLQIWPLGSATCIRKRHNFLVINRKSYDRCGRLAKVCIWKFQVSFFCTAASARYFDTYVCRLAATSASTHPVQTLTTWKSQSQIIGHICGWGQEKKKGGGKLSKTTTFAGSRCLQRAKRACRAAGLARKKGLKDDGEASSLSSAEEEGPIFLSQYSQS